VSRDEDDLSAAAAGLDVLQEIEPGAVGKIQIHERHVGIGFPELVARVLQAVHGARGESFTRDELREAEREVAIVVHDQ
jgi:hypothetical protein